jgi:hypothetical protein
MNRCIMSLDREDGVRTHRGLLAKGGQLTTVGRYAYLNQWGAVGNHEPGGDFVYSVIAENRIRATEFNAYSDRRVKSGIADFPDEVCAELVSKIHQRHYTFRQEPVPKIGWIAQEVEEALPNAVSAVPTEEFPDGFRVLDHSQMTAVLWGAVRQLQAEVARLSSVMYDQECRGRRKRRALGVVGSGQKNR